MLAMLPHFVASLVLVLGTVWTIRTFVGNFGFWVELPVVVAIILAYPTIVRWLGVAPEAWEDPNR